MGCSEARTAASERISVISHPPTQRTGKLGYSRFFPGFKYMSPSGPDQIHDYLALEMIAL